MAKKGKVSKARQQKVLAKTESKTPIKSTNLFWVVGIGASAGGLDAFKQLIKAIPVDSGMAYILVQHLDPNHESILGELLQRSTAIPIREITDRVHVEPDHIYVIPPNKLLTATDGILNLSDRASKVQKNMPIDLFFSSLAEVHQSQAIGVVLSGTGTDGTLGLQAIKRRGGITFAQQRDSAAFGEMPQSAINAEVVDFVLPPDEIVLQLLDMRDEAKENKDAYTPGLLHEDSLFKKILEELDIKKGVDFTYYKQTTIRRRITRRMMLRNLASIEDYFDYLKGNPTEIDTLYHDILIPVTDFFRDPKAFDTLCDIALSALIKSKAVSESLRVWVVGCSTGQEAYSIGICLSEFFEHHHQRVKIQLFATDISETAIVKARAGYYSRGEVSSISEKRLQEFFTKTEHGYQIKKSIRDFCVFASHNILTNPPFADIDLICCRNVLIYMDAFLQRKAMATFHYSLRDKGMLLLGKSESIGPSADLFGPFAEPDKIYTRKSVPSRFIQIATKRREKFATNGMKDKPNEQRPNDDFQRNADDFVLSKSPAGVIVNEQMEVVQFRGATADWLESPHGKPSMNVLKMAKDGLALELRNALHKAKTSQKPITKEGISLQRGSWKRLVTIDVIPLLNTINTYFLIQFKNALEVPIGKKSGNGKNKKTQHEIRSQHLELELSQTREDFRIITEDQEAGHEELLSSNEELLSNSEELHSLNEELEISKEEMQSTVEELSASNQELSVLNEQLNHSQKYAEAIVTTIREALIVLDKNLLVKSANSAFYKTFGGTVKVTEGKLFYELDNGQWDIPDLRKLLERTLIEKEFYESYEVRQVFSTIGERVMLLNARKIFDEGGTEHLILLAIEDITVRRTLEDKLKKSADFLNVILDSSPLLTSVGDADGTVNYYSKSFLDYSGLSTQDGINIGLWGSIIHPSMVAEMRKSKAHSIKTGEDFRMDLLLKRHDGEYRWHSSQALAIRDNDGKIMSWVGTANDVHVQKIFSEELEKKVKERTQELKESVSDLKHSNESLEQFAFVASHDLQEPLRKIKTFSKMLSHDFGNTLPDEGKTLLSKIFSASERMSALIQDVLDFSRVDSANNTFVETSLDSILDRVLDDFTLLIAEKKAIIKRKKLPVLDVAPQQVNQLFSNLLSNSLKFSHDDKQPVITITSRMLAPTEAAKYPSLNPEHAYCEIRLEDNGIGFEEKYAEKIFQIFQRLHSRQQYSGTGIGLALCKKIVVNHHGEIFAESKDNAGAVFHVILPVKQGQNVQ